MAVASVTLTGCPDATMTVSVHFSNEDLNPGIADCTLTFPVERTVAAATEPADVAKAALTELLAGPTAAEEADGYTSWFSAATADDLISVRVDGDTAYVNLADQRATIPNASTSCGSGLYTSELGNTVKEAAGVTRVLYAFDGDPAAFWEFLQVGCDATNDNCDPAPFE